MRQLVRLIVWFSLGVFLAPVLVFAANVSSIEIQGQKKIEKSAIEAKLVSKVGESFSRRKVREDIQALFDTGFFDDVQVSQIGNKLIYRVVEKPTVTSIVYQGNDEVDDSELEEATEIKSYEILNMEKVRSTVAKIEKLYEEEGFFLANVNYQLQKDPEGEIRVVFEITENDKVKVAQVRFLGNRNISSGRLKNVIQTKEGGFFSFLSGSGAYKQDIFDRDIQALYYLVYYNEGYIQAKIDRPQVYVTPDKKNIYITIRIEEGEKYSVGEVNFSGDLMFGDQELYDAVEIKSGDLFVYSTMQKDLRALQAKYGDLGYAYANIIPRTRIRERDRLVDITYEVEKGNKVYIGRINVKGNTKTRDKVLRREMRITEGELYHETRRRESESNIRRLGFFEEVVFNTKTPPGRSDLMDIDIVVKERNTGQIQLGAGYSNFGGFLLNGQIKQTNLFGKGQNLGLSIDYSDVQSIFSLNFTEPYFNDTKWSVGGDIYFRDRDNEQSEYTEERYGASVRVGHPLAPYLRGSVGYKFDETDLELNEGGDSTLFPVETVNGTTSAIVTSLVYDKRDDRFAPTDGVYGSLSAEYAGVGGDLDYTKGLANFRYYKTVFWDVVWRNNLSYGVVTSNDSTRDVPFNELFLLGGANSLRGFDWFSVGKRVYSNTAFTELTGAGVPAALAAKQAYKPFGGEQQLFYNLEFQFPLINEAGIKGVVFYDIGNADDEFSLSEFRSNIGFGFRWFSPIGPLRFEWGFPFDRDPDFGERAVNFEFAIGSPF